ncbi:hypothetical protein JW948_17155 [bacterium]|nr:hypothetical protein [bacterium]
MTVRTVSERSGPDWSQFRNLLRVSLVSEWRASLPSGSGRRTPVWVRRLIFYLVMGFSLGFSLLTRVSPSLYALFTYAYLMMMTAMGIILECSQVLWTPDDPDILYHRPVSSSTLFLARTAHLMIFIAMFSLVLSVGPISMTFLLSGSGTRFPLVYTAGAVLCNLFTAASMILVYTSLLQLFRFEKLRSLITGIQLIFTMVLIFLYQFIARTGWESTTAGFQLSSSWLRWLPPAWFACLVETASGAGQAKPVLWISGILLACLLLFWTGFRKLSRRYLHDLSFSSESPVRARSPVPASQRIRPVLRFWPFIRHAETRAGFYLVLNLLRRDRSVKASMLPMLVMPLVILIWGVIEHDITDPFLMPLLGGGTNSMQMLPFFIAFIFLITSTACAYSQDWEAAWIFHSAPVTSWVRLWAGIRLGLFAGLIIPFYVLLGILFVTQFSAVHALQHTLYLFMLGLVFLSILGFRSKGTPFSKKRERGERMGALAFLVFLIPFQIGAVLLHLVAYQNQTGWFMTMAGLVILWQVLEWIGRRKTILNVK